MRSVLLAISLIAVLAACSGDPDKAATELPPPPSAAEERSAEPSGSPQTDASATTQTPTSPAVPPEPELLPPTPLLPEGPYYPPEAQRPSDRDNDLLLLSGSPVIASGEPLELEGALLDVSGDPIAGASVELWQTDTQGIYLHSEDPRASARDPYFQSYGQSETDAEGQWSFRTIVPAPYEGRPRHLHLKVTLGERELLTTQLFFAGDTDLGADSISAELGENLVAVTISPELLTDEEGLAVQSATHTLVVELTR